MSFVADYIKAIERNVITSNKILNVVSYSDQNTAITLYRIQ